MRAAKTHSWSLSSFHVFNFCLWSWLLRQLTSSVAAHWQFTPTQWHRSLFCVLALSAASIIRDQQLAPFLYVMISGENWACNWWLLDILRLSGHPLNNRCIGYRIRLRGRNSPAASARKNSWLGAGIIKCDRNHVQFLHTFNDQQRARVSLGRQNGFLVSTADSSIAKF